MNFRSVSSVSGTRIARTEVTQQKKVMIKQFWKKEFCFWMVPASEGKVHKFRVRLTSLALAGFGLGLIALGLLFVASDYARVQVVRARNFLNLKMVAAERDQLLSRKEGLLSELLRLKNSNERAVTYEKQVRDRLGELTAILKSVDEQSVNTPREERRSWTIGRSAIGGKEVPCGGKHKRKCPEALKNESPPEDEARASLKPTALNNLAPSAGPPADLVEELDKYLTLLETTPIGSPAAGPVNSGFGYRVSPWGEGLTLHEGVDFDVSYGSPVRATADGVIKEVKFNHTYGLMVDILHSNKIVTRYAHLSKALVTEGQHVCRGKTIGLVGTSGRSTGPHLHYEVLVNNKAINPDKFIELPKRLIAAADSPLESPFA